MVELKCLITLLNRVIILKGKYWPAALDSIKTTLEFDAKKMPQEGVNALNSWLRSIDVQINQILGND